ncbi:hypothetical protein ABW19_dt0209802 [Dactylella cylindrospora]|nr:hypothetical protein ABW19_dt0209802 [Dactylella cylindrospora]
MPHYKELQTECLDAGVKEKAVDTPSSTLVSTPEKYEVVSELTSPPSKVGQSPYPPDVKVIVGPNYQPFDLHIRVITPKSKYFHKVCDAQQMFPDRCDAPIHLPNINPNIFDLLISWMYDKTFPETIDFNDIVEIYEAVMFLQISELQADLKDAVVEWFREDLITLDTALRFANVVYKWKAKPNKYLFWLEGSLIRRVLREMTALQIIQASGTFTDLGWMEVGFRVGLMDMLGKTFLKV